MANPVEKPLIPTPNPAAAAPDWVVAYYSPERPANKPTAPILEALEQMYAYYDA